MNNIIDFEKEKDRILKNRVIDALQNNIIDKRKIIASEICLLGKLYEEGVLSNMDVIVSFNGVDCYYGEKSRDELYLLKDRIDNVKKELKFE